MSSPKRTAIGVFAIAIGLGLVLGLANLVLPDTVSMTLGGNNIEGVDGIWLGIGAGTGIGLLAAGISFLFARAAKRS